MGRGGRGGTPRRGGGGVEGLSGVHLGEDWECMAMSL